MDATLRGDSPPRVDSISVGGGASQDSVQSAHSPIPRPPLTVANGNNVTHSPRSHRHRELPPVPAPSHASSNAPELPPEIPSRHHSSSAPLHLPPPRHAVRPDASHARGPISPPPKPTNVTRPHLPVPTSSATKSNPSRRPVPGRDRPPPSASRGASQTAINPVNKGRGGGGGAPRPALPQRMPVGHTLSREQPISPTPSESSINDMVSRVQIDGDRLLNMVNSGEPVLAYVEDYATLVQDMVEKAPSTGGVQLRLCLANLRGQIGALRDSSTQNNRSKLSETLGIVLTKTKQLSTYL